MKYLLFTALLLLSACGNKPHTTPPVVAMGSKDDRQSNEVRNIFQQYCASCHNPMKDATGPATISVLPTRSIGWLDTFFNHRRWFKPDSSYRARVKEYGLSCPEISISKDQLEILKKQLHRSLGCLRY